jgi:hypothetical protein
MKELEGAAESAVRPFSTVLYVYQPENADADWQNKRLYREAAERLHATIVPDVNGRYAARFGALTSGAVLYFSAARENGKRELLFSGGVTGGRGRVGENAGVEELKAALYSDRETGDGKTPVFGCGLFGKHFIETEAGQ